MLTIREARSEDDKAIGDLLVDAFVTAYARKMPEVVVHDARKQELRDMEQKRRNATVLVAEFDGKIAGTVMILKPGAPGSEAWLKNFADLRHLAIDVKLHGKGFSSALLDEAEAIARDKWHADGICLHVRHGADGVAKLYMKRGFVREPSGDFSKPGVVLDAYVVRFARK